MIRFNLHRPRDYSARFAPPAMVFLMRTNGMHVMREIMTEATSEGVIDVRMFLKGRVSRPPLCRADRTIRQFRALAIPRIHLGIASARYAMNEALAAREH